MGSEPDNLLGVKPIHVSWEEIDRLDWQLWVVAVALIFLLGAGVLGFMIPSVFWFGEALVLQAPQRAFYGLCVLLGLTLVYLLQKRMRLRKLRQALLAERAQWELQLVHSAFHDTLTDLPNRALLLDRLHLALAAARRHKDHQFALIFVDLDRFKLLNDSMGHRMGDQALIVVARTLQHCVRAEDTVARLGGDEFAVLVARVQDDRDVFRVVDRIRHALAMPLNLEGREVFISASMGIALSTTGYEEAENVLRDADTAMYTAKAQGEPSQYAVFDRTMHDYAVKLLQLQTDLRRALERQELVLHYQPIIWLSRGQVAGLEALLRWQHPQRGLVPPADFLPAVEATGLMVPITQWVLHEACRQALAWQSEWPPSWPLSISVNLPPKYLIDDKKVAEIIEVICHHGLPPSKIRLEITENQLMDNLEPVMKALLQFTRFGTRVYIDDFGTGFSSLAYLSRFHVDALKIDQSFVRNVGGDDRNWAIVRSIISLGHTLGLDVIAEGVETAEQMGYLQALRCQYAQGYHFSKPLAPEIVSQSLERWFPVSHDKRRLASRVCAFELFAGLDSEAVLEIAQTCEEARIPAGTVLIREGQIGDFAYLLEEGSVCVYKEESKPLAVLDAPTVFGEMALLNPEVVRVANVRALSDLRVLKVPIVIGLSFLRRLPALKKRLLHLTAERTSSPLDPPSAGGPGLTSA
jgi:diguanylate cyclase (GGDEF)-like protein